MKNINIYIVLLAFSFIAFSCEEEDSLVEGRLDLVDEVSIEEETGTSGSTDLTTYVSLGASITAGYADGALYSHGQDHSWPALLANQFAIEGVGGGAFNQPDIESQNGYFGVDDTGSILGKIILDLDGNDDGELGDVAFVNAVGEIPSAYTGDKTQLNNFGVPGIQTAQMLIAATGGPNAEENPAYSSLYARFASNPGSSTILGDAMDRDPTFFSLWAGGNDVLGYAVSGGTNDAILTDPTAVAGYIGSILDGLMSNGSKGIIISVPNVAVLPYFQAVPRIISVPEASREALLAGIGQINAAIEGWNAAVPADLYRPLLSTDMDVYPLVIEDDNLSDAQVPDGQGGVFVIPKVRNIIGTPITELGDLTELVLLPASPSVSSGEVGISPLAPLSDAQVLDNYELANMLPNLIAINTTIATEAATRSGLMYFDAYTLLLDIALGGGYTSEETSGFTLTPDFTPNGIFSNDGIHLNPRGAAVLANSIIEQMNMSESEGGFGSDIPTMDVMQFNASPFQQ